MQCFFDFKKAFDSISHQKLLSVLKQYGINPALLCIIFSYLTCVVVDGACSKSVPVTSGVPQGSVLGPFLFLLYINNTSDVPLPHGSKIVLYADDLLLYRQINTPMDYEHVQVCLNLLSNWCTSNYLTFNPTKCKTMLFSRKRGPNIPPTLFLGDRPLELVQSYKYLGVTLVSDLSWSEHIESICIKSKKIIGLLYRKFYGYADTTTVLTLYLTLVRPHLEYACQVWNPHTKRNKDLLENVQKFALRMSYSQWNSGYADLLLSSGIPTLYERRLYLSLCLMYKITYSLVHFPPNIFIQRQPGDLCLRSLNSSDTHYVQPFARTTAFLNSYVPSTIHLWNQLPAEVINSSSLFCFKHSVFDYLFGYT